MYSFLSRTKFASSRSNLLFTFGGSRPSALHFNLTFTNKNKLLNTGMADMDIFRRDVLLPLHTFKPALATHYLTLFSCRDTYHPNPHGNTDSFTLSRPNAHLSPLAETTNERLVCYRETERVHVVYGDFRRGRMDRYDGCERDRD